MIKKTWSKILKKFTAGKKIIFFFFKNYNLPIPKASIKDSQATEEAFSPQKRTSSTSKHEISKFFLLFWAIFPLLDPDTDSWPDWIQSRIPDPKHWP